MKILIVLAHPDPASFNHALANAVAGAARELGHDVVLHDLHVERFDPILPAGEAPECAPLAPWLERHCDDLATADGIVIVIQHASGAGAGGLRRSARGDLEAVRLCSLRGEGRAAPDLLCRRHEHAGAAGQVAV